MASADAVAAVQNDLSTLREDIAKIEHDGKQGFLDALDMIQEKVALLVGHDPAAEAGAATSPAKQFEPRSPQEGGPIGSSVPSAGDTTAEPPPPAEDLPVETPADAPAPTDPAADAPADSSTAPPVEQPPVETAPPVEQPPAPGAETPPPPPPPGG